MKALKFTSGQAVFVRLSTIGALLSVALPAVSQPVLEEIIVTSERREASLQDTPLSVGAHSSDALDDAGISNIQELQNIEPGLVSAGNRGSGDSNLNMAIRGIGQRGSRPETGRGVGLYVDDVYYAVTYGSNLQFTDLERVEVLRGPQGTLFGRNNTGGAVRYFTNKAEPGATYGSVDVTLGDDSRQEFTGIANISVSDSAAVRLVYASAEQDGYMGWVDLDGNPTGRDALGAFDNSLLKASVHLEPTDALSVDFSMVTSDSWNNGLAQDAIGLESINAGYGQRLRDAVLNETGVALVADDPRVITGPFTNLDSCLMDGDGLLSTRIATADPANPTNLCNTPREVETRSFNLNVTWDVTDTISLQSITGMTSVESDGIYDWSLFGTYMRQDTADIDFWSQEFQLSGLAMEDRLNWVAGLSWFGMDAREDYNVWVVNTALTPIQDRTEYKNVEDNSFGVFAQGTYALTDRMNLTLGARYSSDEKDYAINRSNRIDGFVVTNDASWNDTNYRVVLDYNWNDDVMTYISYSDAYKAGTFPTNISASGCPFFADYGDPTLCDDSRELAGNADIEAQEPELVENLEVGIRAEFFDRVRLNATAFKMDYSDLQRRSRQPDLDDPDCSGGFENGICDNEYIDGALSAEISGLELELLVSLTDSLTFTGNVASIETEITDNQGAPSLNVGDPLETAPELNYTLGLKHFFMLDNGMQVDSAINYAYKDGYVPPFANNANQMTEDYSTVGARVKLSSADSRWSVALGGSNLTDETYSYGLNYWGAFFGGLVQEGRARGRTYYLDLNYRFGD